MIEIPEAVTLARQLGDALGGKRVRTAAAATAPHAFAWYHGDPAAYGARLAGRAIGAVRSHGGFVEIDVDDARLLFAEGVVLRALGSGDARPKKHQLLVEFEDGSALAASVQMYGGLWAIAATGFENPYYDAARSKPSPLSEAFDRTHFDRLCGEPAVRGLSAKALLATEQRIPGFGNGVLQDVLYEAGVHPRRKVASLADAELERLFGSIKATLAAMTRGGGRDTERDLFGHEGGYPTRASRRTLGRPCPRCGAPIARQAYLGGAVYTCPGCQPL
jgi:formamidopyrimidine-DNA glycosylase